MFQPGAGDDGQRNPLTLVIETVMFPFVPASVPASAWATSEKFAAL